LSQYLLLPNIKGVGEVIIIAAALAGGLLGFLWYNSYPAEIFMGDTGSLAIGAFLGYTAILSKNEVLLILIGIIFVIETVDHVPCGEVVKRSFWHWDQAARHPLDLGFAAKMRH